MAEPCRRPQSHGRAASAGRGRTTTSPRIRGGSAACFRPICRTSGRRRPTAPSTASSPSWATATTWTNAGPTGARAEILEALGAQEPDPLRLLERLDELQALLRQPKSEARGLILSTVHSSKGLEYDRVFLLDVIDGVFPKEGEDVDRDEERRLFYVAMTRARNELAVFTFPPEKTSSAFSQFLFRPKRRIPRKSKKKTAADSFLPGHAGAAQRLWRGAHSGAGGRPCPHPLFQRQRAGVFAGRRRFRTGFSACGRNPVEIPQKPIDTVGNSLYHNLNGPAP